MNRREFLKAVMAAAVVSQIPFTEAEAIEAYESFGIDDMGNGWFRCWISSPDNGETKTFSTYAKSAGSSQMQLCHGKVRAWFDLETGKIGKVEVVDESVIPSIKSDGGLVYGSQLELGERIPTNFIKSEIK